VGCRSWGRNVLRRDERSLITKNGLFFKRRAIEVKEIPRVLSLALVNTVKGSEAREKTLEVVDQVADRVPWRTDRTSYRTVG
jgi:hypothetical protein